MEPTHRNQFCRHQTIGFSSPCTAKAAFLFFAGFSVCGFSWSTKNFTPLFKLYNSKVLQAPASQLCSCLCLCLCPFHASPVPSQLHPFQTCHPHGIDTPPSVCLGEMQLVQGEPAAGLQNNVHSLKPQCDLALQLIALCFPVFINLMPIHANKLKSCETMKKPWQVLLLISLKNILINKAFCKVSLPARSLGAWWSPDCCRPTWALQAWAQASARSARKSKTFYKSDENEDHPIQESSRIPSLWGKSRKQWKS